MRDDNSRRLVGAALGRQPEVVLDPVLQFPAAARAGPAEPDEIPDRPYIAVYGHGFPVWFAEATRRAADRNGRPLVSIGYRNDWADEQRLAAGPHLFARLIAGAAAVATNFFHGCVFALKERKPFAAVTTPYRANKIRDLTGLLGAGERLVEEPGSKAVTALLSEPPPAPVFAAIESLRRRSEAYLDAALG